MSLDLARLVETHIPSPGVTESIVESLALFHWKHPPDRAMSLRRPALGVVLKGTLVSSSAQGEQELGPARYFVVDGAGHVFFRCKSRLRTAAFLNHYRDDQQSSPSPPAQFAHPITALWVYLDTPTISEFVSRFSRSVAPSKIQPHPGLRTTPRTSHFDDALRRLLLLLQDRNGARLLAASRLQELLYIVLSGPLADLVRQTKAIATPIAGILDYLHRNSGRTPSIEELARKAGMSRPVFDRSFKAATSYSPLQYIKHLRLTEACVLLDRGLQVGEVAARVGYRNQSQFSRDFRKKFDLSPRAWGRRYSA